GVPGAPPAIHHAGEGDEAEAGWVPGGGAGLGMPTLSPRGMSAPVVSNIAFAPTQLPPAGQGQIHSTLPIGQPDVAPLQAVDDDAPLKPRWQASLDRALASTGGFIERTLQRFRGASQRAQLVIAIAVGGVV